MSRFIRINGRVLNLDAMLLCQPIQNELGLATGVRLVFPLPVGALELFGPNAEAFFEDVLSRTSPQTPASAAGLDAAEPVPVRPEPARSVALDYRGRPDQREE